MKLVAIVLSWGVLCFADLPNHFDLEWTGMEYREYFKNHPELTRKRHPLDGAVQFGIGLVGLCQ